LKTTTRIVGDITAIPQTPIVQLRNLLFVTGSLYSQESGPFQTLLETVRGLERQGVNTMVVGTKDLPAQPSHPNGWPRALAFRKAGPFSFHYAPEFASWLRTAAPRTDVVSLQSLWNFNNYAAAKWCVRQKIPYVVTLHGNLSPKALSVSRWKKRLAKAWYTSYVLQHASCLHALNEAEYEHVRNYGLKQPVAVIPNGAKLPPEVTPISESKKGLRTCLYLGRLHPIKNLDTLIRVWSSLGKTRAGWKLVLAGPDDGGHEQELKKLVLSLGINDNVAFPGRQTGDDKHSWFRNADCFVLPSLSEGAPVVLLEALSYGLPTLLTSRCNLPEAARCGAAIEVTPSVDALKAGIKRLLTLTHGERSDMASKARRMISESYEWSEIVSRLVNLYSWLADTAEPSACVRFV